MLLQQTPTSEFETTVLRRLANLEEHIVNLIVPLQRITTLLNSEGVGNLISLLNQMPTTLQKIFKTSLEGIRAEIYDLKKSCNEIDIGQAFNEIKYIGNRLKEIEQSIQSIKDGEIKRKIYCNFKLEGFEQEVELIKKTPGDHNDDLSALLETLSDRERSVILWKVFDKRSFAFIGDKMNLSRGRPGQIYQKALRKLRHPSRKKLVQSLDKDKFAELLKLI